VHPAEHRALRELYVFTRQLSIHWQALAARIGEGPDAAALAAGAEGAGAIVTEIVEATAARDLYVARATRFAARLLGVRPPVPDRVLERNQAVRFAALDAQHVLLLLAYVSSLAGARGDAELQAACARWERRLRRHELAVRRAAIALADRPDEAIAPADSSPAGRAGQKITFVLGSVGEWMDRRTATRAGGSADG
jgi:hypothetical protein